MQALHLADRRLRDWPRALATAILASRIVEPDEHVAAAHLLRVLDEHGAHRRRELRRDLRDVGADIGVVGFGMHATRPVRPWHNSRRRSSAKPAASAPNSFLRLALVFAAASSLDAATSSTAFSVGGISLGHFNSPGSGWSGSLESAAEGADQLHVEGEGTGFELGDDEAAR